MIKLKVTCLWGMNLRDECVRVLALDDAASLLDLHELIQKSVDFDNDHPYEFYTAATYRSYSTRESLVDDMGWEEAFLDYDTVALSDIWPLPKRRYLYYWFDFGDDWKFEIKKLRTSKADLDVKTPKVLERIGPNPEQYPKFE